MSQSCKRCGVDLPPTLPSPMTYVTMSGPVGGREWIFCAEKCAAVIEAWLDHTWVPGEYSPAVAIDANGHFQEIIATSRG